MEDTKTCEESVKEERERIRNMLEDNYPMIDLLKMGGGGEEARNEIRKQGYTQALNEVNDFIKQDH